MAALCKTCWAVIDVAPNPSSMRYSRWCEAWVAVLQTRNFRTNKVTRWLMNLSLRIEEWCSDAVDVVSDASRAENVGLVWMSSIRASDTQDAAVMYISVCVLYTHRIWCKRHMLAKCKCTGNAFCARHSVTNIGHNLGTCVQNEQVWSSCCCTTQTHRYRCPGSGLVWNFVLGLVWSFYTVRQPCMFSIKNVLGPESLALHFLYSSPY